jgi:hypothetical protein
MPAPSNEPSATIPVIYSPPRPGLPYLVVTFTGDKVDVRPAANRHQARLMLAQLAPKPKPKE